MQQTSRAALVPASRLQAQRATIGVILLALLIGAALRLVEIGRPFASGDHAEVASIVSFFYPRDLQSLSAHSSVLHLIENPHGVAPVLLALVWISVIGMLNIPITEFWWNLPFGLLGLVAIPLAYALGKQLNGKRAGVLAALFTAVLPVHASLSRASGGGSHIAIAFVVQLWAVSSVLRYYEAPNPRHCRQASLAVACAVLTDVLLPLLFFMLLAVGVLAVQSDAATLRSRLAKARSLLFDTRLMRWPLLALALPVGMLIVRQRGLLARLFRGSGREPGIRLGDFLDNAVLNVGPLTLLVLCLCAAVGLPAVARLEKRGLLLVWSALYLGPFMFFTRPYVFDFYLLGMAPLIFNAAVLFADWLRSPSRARRAAGFAAAALLFVLLGLRSVTMITGADFGPLIGTGRAAGALFPDLGLKSAAAWVRANSSTDAVVFADPVYETYQLAYYLHRPFIGSTDAATAEEGYRLLSQRPAPDFYLIRPDNEGLLRRYARGPLHRVLTVTDDSGAPVLYAYSARQLRPSVLTTAQGNVQFDAAYSDWNVMFRIGNAAR